LLLRTLRGAGHVVHAAADGEAGLALIRAIHPDLVLTDVAMPRRDGLALCDAIHADPALAGIPIALVTASVQRHQLVAAERHGVAAIIAKPFTLPELRARVVALLAGAPVA